MYLFLLPLLLGFLFNSASAFTTYYSHKFGEKAGRLVSMVLRDVVGIPMWAIGYVLATRVNSPRFFNPVLVSSILAWLLILAGGVIILVGLLSIRWQAAAPKLQDSIVDHGVYTCIRHPLYSGMILELLGLFFWIPTHTMLVACTSGILWVMVQARLEEIDLLQRMPAYQDYMRRVPRFIPRFKL